MRAFDEAANRLKADIDRDQHHGCCDAVLRTSLESLRADGIAPLAPKPPDQHDRGRGVEERIQREAGQRRAVVDDRDYECQRAYGAVPGDREVRQPKGRAQERRPVGDADPDQRRVADCDHNAFQRASSW